jgi:D-sedoheptulose 7-phosphate isomerase
VKPGASAFPASDFAGYAGRLARMLQGVDWTPVSRLAYELFDCWQTGRRVFLAGNGGSGANALHLANDFLCALDKTGRSGIRAQALVTNQAVMTCLANDSGYEQVFAAQLVVLANPGDVLIAYSGSGNSANVLRALEQARRMEMRSYAFLGYGGGKAKALADVPIHFPVDDMQIAEDAQLITGHMILQALRRQKAHAEATAVTSHDG